MMWVYFFQNRHYFNISILLSLYILEILNQYDWLNQSDISEIDMRRPFLVFPILKNPKTDIFLPPPHFKKQSFVPRCLGSTNFLFWIYIFLVYVSKKVLRLDWKLNTKHYCAICAWLAIGSKQIKGWEIGRNSKKRKKRGPEK